jgi:hypothetical protein
MPFSTTITRCCRGRQRRANRTARWRRSRCATVMRNRGLRLTHSIGSTFSATQRPLEQFHGGRHGRSLHVCGLARQRASHETTSYYLRIRVQNEGNDTARKR